MPRPSSGAVLLFLLLAAGGARAASPLKSWINGPVRYIAEAEETKVFKKLKTDEDRAFFIERFWARRDPSPDTLANEYRQLFWERVNDANRLFLDSPKEGWRTDRGKIYVLYGPPTRIEDLPTLRTEAGPTAGQGLIRWYYEGRPGGRTDVNPVVIVPFVRESTGEYRVSYDPELSSVFFDELAVREQWDRGYNRFLEIFGAPRPTELSVMLDLGRMQEVPPQAQVLLERVETVESYSTHPIDVNISRYLHPDRDGAVVVVTADVSDIGPEAHPAVIARFKPVGAAEGQRMLGEDSFRIVDKDGRRVAQGRIVLDPGEYQFTVLVADPTTAATGMQRGRILAPQPSPQLRMSDVVWAEELSPLEYGSMASYDEPFLVGPFRVVPRLDTTFRQGDTLTLFYEVYGGDPPYRVAYQIEGQELDGTWVELGQPSVSELTGASQGWGLPTSPAWPAGEYRVRIEVADDHDRLVTAQMPFELSATDTN